MCGVFGIFSQEEYVSQEIFDALTVLQHRGQDAAGIATLEHSGKIHLKKGNGLVRDVLHTRHMIALQGSMGIGHVRYPTAGSQHPDEAQPFYVNSPYGITLVHNGNLTNADDLAREVFQADLRHLSTGSDSEVLLNVFAHELAQRQTCAPQPYDVFAAISSVHKRVRGAYAVVGLIANVGLFAFRDPNGIRPLCLGSRVHASGKKEYAISSESVAFSPMGFSLERDVAPGEGVFISCSGEITTMQCASDSQHTPCLFEFVYMSRPDSIIDAVSVYKTRLRMGEFLGNKIQKESPNHDFDVVIPIPESSRTSALQLANTLGIKYREGFIKNRYIGRTFIMPQQKIRKKSVRYKLSAIDLEFRVKHVLLVDDSIVRGTTSQEIIRMAREAGAQKVSFASAAPPVRFPNVYGIDMPTRQELIAHGRTQEEIQESIGADALYYQGLEDLKKSATTGNPKITHFDASCFDGKYITGDIDEDFLQKIEQFRRNSPAIRDDSEATMRSDEML